MRKGRKTINVAVKQDKSKKITFKLYAPEAHTVSLAGDFNSWNTATHFLRKYSDGTWKRIINLPPGRYEYRFLVDGKWHNDPHCTCYTPNPFGSENCTIIL